jgi:hypothetical protein
MANENLLTVFVGLTAVAVLLQTGILVGYYFVTSKLIRQAEAAVAATRGVLTPIQNVTENLQSVSTRIAEFGAVTHGQLQQFENWWRSRRSA